MMTAGSEEIKVLETSKIRGGREKAKFVRKRREAKRRSKWLTYARLRRQAAGVAAKKCINGRTQLLSAQEPIALKSLFLFDR